jgi:hypothetical protein
MSSLSTHIRGSGRPGALACALSLLCGAIAFPAAGHGRLIGIR